MKRKYDSTVARIAGNIASGWAAPAPSVCYEEDIAKAAVRLARLVIQFTIESEPFCNVIGAPNGEERRCELREGHEGYHQQGKSRWLGYPEVSE